MKPGVSAFLTLCEILMFQYGADLLSHKSAVRADAASPGGSIGMWTTVIASRTTRRRLVLSIGYGAEAPGVRQVIRQRHHFRQRYR